MVGSETDLLTNYLVQPSALTSIVTFEQFRAFFPASFQDSPQIRSLFRDLRAQRELTIAQVTANIEDEARRGNTMRREVLQAKREAMAAAEDADGEIELERALFGKNSGATKTKHTLSTIVPDLEGAAEALTAEIARLEEEEAVLSEAVSQTVGNLSDLRYGKFANAEIRDDIVNGLTSLEETCNAKT